MRLGLYKNLLLSFVLLRVEGRIIAKLNPAVRRFEGEGNFYDQSPNSPFPERRKTRDKVESKQVLNQLKLFRLDINSSLSSFWDW
jgi:hypothetical protein